MPFRTIGIYQQAHQPFSTNKPTGFMAIMRALHCGVDVVATHTSLPGVVLREQCNDWALAAKFAAACKTEFDRKLAPKSYEERQMETAGFYWD